MGEHDSAGAGAQETRLSPLLPPGDPLEPALLVEQLGLWERPSSPPPRPRVLLNMVATADGRATLGGRSGPISDEADRALFHALRSACDAVLVGAGTVRTERYGPLIRDAPRRAERERRGMAAEPIACIVSGRLELGEGIPLLQNADSRVVIITASQASLPAGGAQIDYIRSAGAQLDLGAALAELAERYGVASLLCEGGPHLAMQLLGAGLLDELFLSVSPLLAGGAAAGAGAEGLRILAGGELQEPARLELLSALHASSTLFLRYAVSAR
jgi:riboflavin biosynthesis pyrimidine reductase